MSHEDYVIKEGEFEYLDKGEGHTILLLHGLFGAMSNFTEVIEEFSKNYRVVVPILPLFSSPLVKTGVKGMSDHVSKFIKHKKLSDFTILGNSLGGHIALVCTLRHQELIHSLVLTGSSGLYENAFGGSFPRREDKEYLRGKIAFTFYDPAVATDELVDEVYNVVSDRTKLVRILALAKSAIRHNMEKELHLITVPTCLIWGKNDQITPPHVAEEFNGKIKNSDLYWIDKCGHAAMMEHPEEFNEILGNWLSKLENSKA